MPAVFFIKKTPKEESKSPLQISPLLHLLPGEVDPHVRVEPDPPAKLLGADDAQQSQVGLKRERDVGLVPEIFFFKK